MMTREEQLDFSTAGPPITMFVGNHYLERGTECGTFLETASLDGEEEGIGANTCLNVSGRPATAGVLISILGEAL